MAYAEIKAARAKVNTFKFGTAEWENAMVKVRALVDAHNTKSQAVEFFSVDSGMHRTLLANGRTA